MQYDVTLIWQCRKPFGCVSLWTCCLIKTPDICLTKKNGVMQWICWDTSPVDGKPVAMKKLGGKSKDLWIAATEMDAQLMPIKMHLFGCVPISHLPIAVFKAFLAAEVLANVAWQIWNILLPIGVFTQHCWQHQRIWVQICVQTCLHVLCEFGLSTEQNFWARSKIPEHQAKLLQNCLALSKNAPKLLSTKQNSCAPSKIASKLLSTKQPLASCFAKKNSIFSWKKLLRTPNSLTCLIFFYFCLFFW